MSFKLPECCKGCNSLDSETQDYCPPSYYCIKNIWWPEKKQTCKKARYNPDPIHPEILELLKAKVFDSGGDELKFNALVELSVEISKRGGFNTEGIIMIIVDCLDGQFSRENMIKQMKTNLGNFRTVDL